MPSTSWAVVVSALLRTSSAIFVAKGSPCSINCGNVLDSTPPDDLVCSAVDYSMTSQGTVFKRCVECESRSDFMIPGTTPIQSDLQAMLSCGPLQDSLEYEGLATNASVYGYCSVWNKDQVEHCSKCLVVMDGGIFLNNYLQVLNGACNLLLKEPATIPLDGDIFSDTEQVNVTMPTPTSTFVSDARVGKLTYGAIAGIAVGAAVFLLIVVGCGVVLNGKRKRKAYLREREKLQKNWPGQGGGAGGEMFETPISQRPLRGWEDSPVSAATERSYPQYFSPYTSQYNSPVSAAEAVPGSVAWPAEKTRNIGVALSPDHEGSTAWGDAKGKERAGADGDGYELQEGIHGGGGGHQYPYVPPPPPHQAPTLNHPGYGRRGPTPPGTSES